MQINKTQPIHFGTMERTFYHAGKGINNYTNLFQVNKSPQEVVVNTLADFMKSSPKIDMKIFGCSDMSQFIGRIMTMDWLKGKAVRQKLFSKAAVELVDLDADVINRAKQRIIGLTQADFDDMYSFYDFKPERYFKKMNEPHFLENEAKAIKTEPFVEPRKIINKDGSVLTPYYHNGMRHIGFYKINKDVLQGVNIRQGNILQDVKNMPETPADTGRIIEFSQGWHFLDEAERMELASGIAQKTKPGDVLLMYESDLEYMSVNKLREFGFERMDVDNPFKFFCRT